MTKEQIYTEQLQKLGLWEEAFRPEVHDLAVMERELTRLLKAWKAEGSSPTSDIFRTICSMRRDILTHRDALGLTPRGLQRLRGKNAGAAEDESDSIGNRLNAILERTRAYD